MKEVAAMIRRHFEDITINFDGTRAILKRLPAEAGSRMGAGQHHYGPASDTQPVSQTLRPVRSQWGKTFRCSRRSLCRLGKRCEGARPVLTGPVALDPAQRVRWSRNRLTDYSAFVLPTFSAICTSHPHDGGIVAERYCLPGPCRSQGFAH